MNKLKVSLQADSEIGPVKADFEDD